MILTKRRRAACDAIKTHFFVSESLVAFKLSGSCLGK
jgi:hypothetical protein